MSRAIKFRVWDGNKYANQKFLVFDYDRDGNLIAYRDWREHEDGCAIGSQVIEQWTGLKDKNGQEIYEGDIIQHPRDKSMDGAVVFGKIGYDGDACGMTGFSLDSKFYHSQGGFYNLDFGDNYEQVVVVGNIHEGIAHEQS